MSSVLHPVGPEPPQTYWVRRLLVIAAAAVALVIILALIVNTRGGQAAVPQAPVSTAAVSTPGASDPAVTPTSSPSGSTSRSTPSPSSQSSSREPSSRESSPRETSSRQPSTSTAPKAGPAECAADDLRATLTGKPTLKEKQGNRFNLSLINGSSASCLVSATRKNFELKIYSGTDRIWSSKDCPAEVKAVTEKVESEGAVEWKISWNGRRSLPRCKQSAEVPLPGTYFATAELDGAQPVQLRMVIRG